MPKSKKAKTNKALSHSEKIKAGIARAKKARGGILHFSKGKKEGNVKIEVRPRLAGARQGMVLVTLGALRFTKAISRDEVVELVSKLA